MPYYEEDVGCVYRVETGVQATFLRPSPSPSVQTPSQTHLRHCPPPSLDWPGDCHLVHPGDERSACPSIRWTCPTVGR